MHTQRISKTLSPASASKFADVPEIPHPAFSATCPEISPTQTDIALHLPNIALHAIAASAERKRTATLAACNQDQNASALHGVTYDFTTTEFERAHSSLSGRGHLAIGLRHQSCGG
jgi:hypothetical protein